MSLAEDMRNHNKYKQMFNFGRYMPGECFAEQDIRFAEFIDWLNEQPQNMQDVVTVAMQFAIAYHTKFDPKEFNRSDNDWDNLKRVEEAQKRLGVDFLYDRIDK